jgi:hypothetical protein
MALISKEEFEEILKNEFENTSAETFKELMVSLIDIFKLDENLRNKDGSFNKESFVFQVWENAWCNKKLSFKQWKCLKAYKVKQTKNEIFKSF